MTRVCTACTHPQRREIDKLIMGGESSYRRLGTQFGVGEKSLRSHAVDHLLPELVESWQEERSQSAQELIDELREWMRRLKAQHDACDAFLRDPDDPERYTLAPHTWEVVIHTSVDRGPDRRPIRRKMKLSEALARVDGMPGIGDVEFAETKIADPRELLLKTSARLETHLRLVGEFLGKIATQGTQGGSFLQTAEWTTLRTRMIEALRDFPEARLALVDALEGVGATGAGGFPLPAAPVR